MRHLFSISILLLVATITACSSGPQKTNRDVFGIRHEILSAVKSLYGPMVSNPEDLESVMDQLKVTLMPFEETYYSTDYHSKKDLSQSGNRITDVSLLGAAILIILIALINFINFFFALYLRG